MDSVQCGWFSSVSSQPFLTNLRTYNLLSLTCTTYILKLHNSDTYNPQSHSNNNLDTYNLKFPYLPTKTKLPTPE